MDRPHDVPRDGLYIAALGPLAAWLDGAALDLGSPQQQKLLALLVLRRNEHVSTDALVDHLWGEHAPTNGVQTIRNHVSRLRQLLADNGKVLVTERGGYRLAIDGGGIDLDRFQARMAAGRAALLAGNARRAEQRLRSALSLVRDTPLAGLEYDDAVALEREHIDELALLIAEDLGDALLAQGRHRELIGELRERVIEHPFRERFWAQLMLALYRSDRQAEALDAYRAARDRLREELGIEPGRELRTLERMILLQERTLDHDMVARLHGVPRHRGALIGRQAILALLRRRLPRERVMTLIGPAGVGKTRLAAELAAAVRNRFPDGIWWIRLEDTDAAEVPSTVARALGIRESGAGPPAPDLIVERLRGATALLVLDDCDRVSAEVGALVTAIVRGTGSVAVLVTAREALRIEGESVHAVDALATPDAGMPSTEILRSDAVRMLLSRSGAAGHRPQPGDAVALGDVVTRLDGLPLAIELAADKLVAMSAAELARSLEQGFGLLSSPERATMDRHRTLDAALAWSYELLSADQQRVLRRLSVFPGSFDAAAADAVVGDPRAGAETLATVVGLVGKSLVVADVGNPTRYRLLGVIREFARALTAETEATTTARLHRDHYLGIAERVAAHMLDGELRAWLRVGSREHDNLLAALQWSVDEGDGELSLQMASALGAFWYRIGFIREGRALIESALALAGPSSPWRARGLVNRAWLAYATGAADTLEVTRQAVEATDPGSELRGFALARLAHQRDLPGGAEEPDPALEEARAIFERIGQAEGIALIDQIAGMSALHRGAVNAAIDLLSRSRDRYRELRGNLDAGWTLVALARAALAGTDVGLATESASAAVRDFRSRGDQRGVAAGLTCLGRTRIAAGDRERARLLLGEAIQIAAAQGYGPEATEAREVLGGVRE